MSGAGFNRTGRTCPTEPFSLAGAASCTVQVRFAPRAAGPASGSLQALGDAGQTASGGFVSKRRLSAWASLCALINCDADDFRTIGANQTLNGFISPAGDVDHYYFFGTVGQRLSLRMNRTNGSLVQAAPVLVDESRTSLSAPDAARHTELAGRLTFSKLRQARELMASDQDE